MARPSGDARMRAVARDTRGAIAVMTALVMPVLIGVAAYAIDASLLLYRQERMQIAADVGAWAGAELLQDGRSEADVIAFSAAVVAANADAPAGSAPEITVTLPNPTRIEITIMLDVERIFSRFFRTGASRIFAASAAAIEGAAEPSTCVYLDEPEADGSLLLLNGARLALTGCDVAVASTSNRAVEMLGGTALVTDCLTTAGRVVRAERVTSGCPGINQRAAVPLPDPLPAAPEPPSICSGTVSPNVALSNFQNGRPSCGGVLINGNVDLPAGTYFMSRGNLLIGGSGRLTLAPGSVLVLMDSAQITMDFRGELVITASTVGNLADIAIISGSARLAGGVNSLGKLDIEGLIALPGEDVLVTGGTMANRCTRIHARKLSLNPGTRFNITCALLETGSQIRLVPPES